MTDAQSVNPEPSGAASVPAAAVDPPPGAAPVATNPHDWRAVIVLVVGLAVVLLIVITAAFALPGSVPQGQVNNKGTNIVSIASAAFTAISAVIAAYFGVKVANLAREDANKTGKEHAIQLARLAGAAEPDKAKAALDEALKAISGMGH